MRIIHLRKKHNFCLPSKSRKKKEGKPNFRKMSPLLGKNLSNVGNFTTDTTAINTFF